MSLKIYGTTSSKLMPTDSAPAPRTIGATGASRRLGLNSGAVSPNVPTAKAQPPATVVVNGKKTSYPDLPVISTLSVKQLATPGQVEALRSATTNTAKAFDLPIAVSADRAIFQQNKLNSGLSVGSMVTVDLVIDPP